MATIECKRVTRLAAALALALAAALGGCASMSERNVSKQGPQGLFVKQRNISAVDLLALVSGGTATDASVNDEKDYPSALDQALGRLTGTEREARRNLVLDRLVMASNDLCEEYKTVLKKKQAGANFWYGLAAVVSGAAGAAATGATAAKNLAAVSGVSSGLRAEHNNAYYADLAAQVIVKGINRRRDNILGEIMQARECPERQYSVEMAIADVVTYHGACSLIGGLEQADSAIGGVRVTAGIDALASNRFFAEAFAGAASAPAAATAAPPAGAAAPAAAGAASAPESGARSHVRCSVRPVS